MFTVTAHPLPSNFKGTPQELLEAWLDRIEITADEVAMISSDVMPTGNQGPWFKNGTQLWVWNGTEYRPIDVTNSVDPEVFIGVDEPDEEAYPLWFRISEDSEPMGLYTFLDGAWTTQDLGLQPNSITEQKIADIAITSEKLALLSVTSAKLANDLSLEIWETGDANTFARMNEGATSAVWHEGRIVSEDMTITSGDHEFEHGLGALPLRVDIYFVAKTNMAYSSPFQTLFVGDAADIRFVSAGAYLDTVRVTATKVIINIPPGSVYRPHVGFASSGTTYSLATNFNLRFHVTPQ